MSYERLPPAAPVDGDDNKRITITPAVPAPTSTIAAPPTSAADSAVPLTASETDPSASEVVCRICGSGEDRHLLIVPCNCSGSLAHVHTTCLQMWISTRPQRNANLAAGGIQPSNQPLPAQGLGLDELVVQRDDNAQPRLPGTGTGSAGDDHKLICEICHSEYRLTIQYTFHFSFERCLRCESIGHGFEIAILLIMLGVCIAIWPILKARSIADADGGGAFGVGASGDAVLIPLISLGMIALTLFTLYRVVKRWIRANSIVTIVPRAPPPPAATRTAATAALSSGGGGNLPLTVTAANTAAANSAANRARLRPVV